MSEKISRWPTGAWYYYLEPKINKVEKREKGNETSIDWLWTGLSFIFYKFDLTINGDPLTYHIACIGF